MIGTYFDARDSLYAKLILNTAEVIALVGYVPKIVYQGVESIDKLPTDEFWMRISQQTVLEEQATLSGNDLKRRYTTDGLLFVQIFIPKTLPQNYAIGVKLAVFVKNLYRGKQTEDCIWFRNVRIQELPAEDAWNRLNVVAEYQYDEIG